MANKTEDRLLNLFSEASGETRGSNADATPGSIDISHADSASDYTNGPAEPSSFDASLDSGAGQSFHGTSGSASSSANSGGGGIGSTLESVAGSVFGGALGLVPLVGSLFGLFGGGSKQQPVFEKYEMPSSISFEAAETGSGLVNSDYGQMGLPRLYDSSETDATSGATSSTSGANTATTPTASPAGSNSATTGGAGSGMPQISVNVQAMDAQSFMSYSGDIAKAVRDAMLNLSSINDVVTEL
jgi:hypothetical protein